MTAAQAENKRNNGKYLTNTMKANGIIRRAVLRIGSPLANETKAASWPTTPDTSFWKKVTFKYMYIYTYTFPFSS